MLTLAVYCVLVFAASWVGGALPALFKLTHTRLQLLISLVGGLMLGVGLLHQLPHAVGALSEAAVESPLDLGVLWLVIGLTVMFFLLRTFHFHQHDLGEGGVQELVQHDHGHDHDHDHDDGAHEHHAPASASWMGLVFGLSIHTLGDGLALASNFEADLVHIPDGYLPGLGTFLGVLLHKPLDSLSITSVMSARGASVASQRWLNALYALICPLGALLFLWGLRSMTANQNLVAGCALAFSAGMFVCIALSDLLPEVQFHAHDRVPLSLSLLVGLLLAWCIGFFEPEHSHNHDRAHPPGASRDLHGHDHTRAH